MTTVKAQQMVASARVYLVGQRQAGIHGDTFSGSEAYREAWNILFAAENLLSDPNQPRYARILRAEVAL